MCERKNAVVLEQHDRLFGGLEGDLAMGGRGDLAHGDVAVPVRSGRVEQAELGARGEDAFGRCRDQGFGHDAVANGLRQRVESRRPDGTGKVGAGLERQSGGMGDVRRVMVAFSHIDDGAAIGDNETLELPCLAQMLLEQHGVVAGSLAVDCVVGAHDGFHMSVDNRGAKGRKVGLFEVAGRDIHVEGVPLRLGAGVHGEVLAGGHRFGVVRIAALHAFDEGAPHASGEERIFAVGLLPAPPARVAKDIDIRRPEGQPVEDAVIALALRLVELGAALGGDDVAHLVDDRRIPRRGHADGLREDGRVAGAGDPVERLIPGLVVGDAEARDGRGKVLQLRGLFVERHAGDKVVGAGDGGLAGILIDRAGGLGGHVGGNRSGYQAEKGGEKTSHGQTYFTGGVQTETSCSQRGVTAVSD